MKKVNKLGRYLAFGQRGPFRFQHFDEVIPLHWGFAIRLFGASKTWAYAGAAVCHRLHHWLHSQIRHKE